MFPYIVAVEDNNVTHISFNQGEQRGVVFHKEAGVEIKTSYIGDEAFWADVKVAYFKDEVSALLAAQKIAQAQPTKSVLVAHTTNVVFCPPSEAVVSSVTDKGVLPK